LDNGVSPGILVEQVSRARLQFVRTSRSAYHFEIVSGPDAGTQTAYYRKGFREMVLRGTYAPADEVQMAFEDMGYVRFPEDAVLKEIAARIALYAVRNNTPSRTTTLKMPSLMPK